VVAGDPAGQVVLAIPATRELLAASPPRRALASAYAAAADEPLTPDPRKAKKALRTVSILLVAQWALACVVVIWQTHANDIALALLALHSRSRRDAGHPATGPAESNRLVETAPTATKRELRGSGPLKAGRGTFALGTH
jgi:hypothetical protein